MGTQKCQTPTNGGLWVRPLLPTGSLCRKVVLVLFMVECNILAFSYLFKKECYMGKQKFHQNLPKQFSFLTRILLYEFTFSLLEIELYKIIKLSK